MGGAFFAEASPCCPSPVFGQLIIVAYVVGGAFVYVWMFSMLFKWAHARYRRHGTTTERNRQ